MFSLVINKRSVIGYVVFRSGHCKNSLVCYMDSYQKLLWLVFFIYTLYTYTFIHLYTKVYSLEAPWMTDGLSFSFLLWSCVPLSISQFWILMRKPFVMPPSISIKYVIEKKAICIIITQRSWTVRLLKRISFAGII